MTLNEYIDILNEQLPDELKISKNGYWGELMGISGKINDEDIWLVKEKRSTKYNQTILTLGFKPIPNVEKAP